MEKIHENEHKTVLLQQIRKYLIFFYELHEKKINVLFKVNHKNVH